MTMGLIHVLDAKTAQSIAAGEVVERPASVVKELCENSLDAGANRVRIYIEQGGIKCVRVTDNGCGMSQEDAKLAFEDHATSKIRAIEDLDSLLTMGFRGEALPTIAAVSRVTLTTRRAEDERGSKIRIEGGEFKDQLPWAGSAGTTIEVRDIFYNTPARFKFLKKDQTEAQRITETVQDLALSRPDVSFYLENQGKEVLHTPGDNQLLSAIYAVFGRQLAKSMVPILPPPVPSMVTCEGYLSLPEESRRSRNWQLFFVNGRPIKAPVLTRALEDAYKSTIMIGRFPAAVLKLNLPMNLVDVNVHPRKLEVRFWNESEVYRAVYEQVQNSLFTALRPPAPALTETPEEASESLPEPTPETPAMPAEATEASGVSGASGARYPFAEQERRPSGFSFSSAPPAGERPVLQFNLDGFSATGLAEEKKVYQHFPVRDLPAAQEGAAAPQSEETEPAKEAPQAREQLSYAPQADEDELAGLRRARFAGQLFRTYLLFEDGDLVYVIDQHAAHEKVLFEKAVLEYAKTRRIASQMLLEPETMEVSPSEAQFIEENAEFFSAFGFDVSFFGRGKIILRAIPIGHGVLEPAKAFRSLLDEAMENGIEHVKGESDIIYHMLATSSCKAAVKAHDPLKPEEISALREQLLALSNPYHCPHGRPVIIEIRRQELEKLFKRIV